jgi:hypothetical protein
MYLPSNIGIHYKNFVVPPQTYTFAQLFLLVYSHFLIELLSVVSCDNSALDQSLKIPTSFQNLEYILVWYKCAVSSAEGALGGGGGT